MRWRLTHESAFETGGVAKGAGNLELAKELLGSPRRITISTVIEQWNIGKSSGC